MRARPKTNGRWIVLEQTPRWSSSIRVACRVDRRVRWLGRAIVDTGSEDRCLETLRRFPASFITLEITPIHFADQLGLTVRLSREFPASRVAVVSSCDDDANTWAIRKLALCEAGAIIAAENVWCIDRLLVYAERHLSSRSHSPDLRFAERIWSELPWADL